MPLAAAYLRQCFLVTTGDRHARAFGLEGPGRRQADAAVAAKHHHGLAGEAHQNIPLELADFSGTGWATSQCSAILQCSTRRMSITASPRSPGANLACECTATRLPSAMMRLIE